MSFFSKYNRLLATRPLATNVISTGFLFGAGDFIAQKIESRENSSPFDGARSARAIIYGGILFAPFADKWYKFLNRIKFANPVLSTAARVAVDQGVFAPIVAVPAYFSAMGLMEGKSWEDIRKKLQLNWWPTLKANWSVWPAVQLLNFGFVPVNLRLLVVNLVSLGWNSYILMVNGRKTEMASVAA